MTYYAINTKDGLAVSPHPSYIEAAEHLLAQLGDDYGDDYWIEDGVLKTNPHSRLDFSVTIVDGEQALITEVMSYDPDYLPTALRIVADAIEIANKN